MNGTLLTVKTHKQPVHTTLKDMFVRVTESPYNYEQGVGVCISNNGFQSTGITLSVELYDTLRAALECPKVIEYIETLRNNGAN